MKRKLFVLLCAVMAAAGVKAYTGSTPTAGNTYYLYHPSLNQFLFVGLDETYGVTPSVFNATPIYVETGGSGNSSTTFSFVIRGTKYYMYQYKGNGSLNTGSGSNFEPKLSGDKYRLQTEKNDPAVGATTYRMLHAKTSGGTCSFEEYKSSSSDGYEWQFISESEVESARSAMAERCASTAASYATTSKGWERVTSMNELQASPENYFFAIFSANAEGLMLQATSNNTESQKLHYQTAVDPASGAQYLFEMENHESGGVALKSCAIGKYFANATSTPWFFHADQTSATSSTKLTLTYANGAYTIETAQATFYVGLWTLTTDWYSTGKILAGNKQSSLAGSFLIYRIPKQRLHNVDFTQCITNPSFEKDDDGHVGATGWTVENTANDTKVHLNSNSTYTMTNVDGDKLFNTWNGDNTGYKISQTLQSLPAGYYKVTAVMAAFADKTLQLIANDVTGTAPSVDKSTGVEVTTYVPLATSGNLTISAKTADNGFYKVDNFRLTYLGGMEDLTAVSGQMNTAVNTAQQNAISTYNSNKTATNYIAAMDAIDAAESSIAAYANAKSYLDAMETLLGTTNIYTTAAYATNYSTPLAAYNDGTLTDEAANALSLGSRVTGNMPALLLSPWTAGDGTTQTASLTADIPYINTWSVEGDSDGSNFRTPFFEYWTGDGDNLAAKTFIATVDGLPATSSYEVEVWARVRQKNNGTKQSGSITMKVGSGDAVDLTAGTQVGTSQFYLDHFTARGSTDGSGNLTITIAVADNSGISWLSFRDMKYARLAESTDYEALSSAISTATAKTLGFEVGEYAPYNNIDALTALAAAKDIDQAALNTKASVQAATSNLTGVVWTANTERLNAVYDGDFSESETGEYADTKAVTGWGKVVGMRQVVTSGVEGSPLYHKNGIYVWGSNTVTYGNTIGYTLPLGAHKIYRVSYNRASWDNNTSGEIDIRNSSNEQVAFFNTNRTTGDYVTAGKYDENGAQFVSEAIYFVTGAETDNYTLSLTPLGNAVFTDVELIAVDELPLESSIYYMAGTYPSVTLARTFSADKWNTLCVPFAFDASGFSQVKELSAIAVHGDNVSMTLSDVTGTTTAGKPYLVKARSNGDGLTATDVALPGAVIQTSSATAADYTVNYVGCYTGTTLTAASNANAYVVSNNMLYNVTSDVTVGEYRAYFTVTAPASVKALTFDFDGTTDIDDIVDRKSSDGQLYNLAGQKLSRPQKGVNIIDGKKVLVK